MHHFGTRERIVDRISSHSFPLEQTFTIVHCGACEV